MVGLEREVLVEVGVRMRVCAGPCRGGTVVQRERELVELPLELLRGCSCNRPGFSRRVDCSWFGSQESSQAQVHVHVQV